MTLLAVLGDCTTTTAVALAATWPGDDDVIVVEFDPSGGSLSGWLDAPSSPTLGTIVANGTSDPTTMLATVRAMTHRSASGIGFIAAPIRSRAAARAIDEAAAVVVPVVDRQQDLVAIVDLGRCVATQLPSTVIDRAAVTVVVHRQERASAAATTVRLERLLELVEQLGAPTLLAIVGDDPFDPAEIADFVEESVPGSIIGWAPIADDPLGAAVIAGRSGVSASRLRRLPLMRTAATAAGQLRARLLTTESVAP